MKKLLLVLVTLLALGRPQPLRADIVGNYTADANTLFLLHLDEAAGTSVITNYGSKGGKFYTVTEAAATTTPALVTTMLGAAAYVNGPTNFISSMTNPTAGYLAGYDFNNSGAYQGDASGSSLSADALAMTNLNIGLGGQSSFTIEALIRPTGIASATGQEIVCTDSSAGSRGFQFRIISGTLQFQFINGSQALSGTIPTTGNDAFVAGNWYHVAITYNGTTATLYWTLLNPTNGAAHVLSSAALALGTTQGNTTGPLCIGNENRNTAGEQFFGSIDEVRISSVARGSGQMQFYSPLVTITQNPVSQNVDYNQPVTFTVGASSQFPLGYQWRFNSNSIAGATNTSYVITNVASFNAGFYDCVVTNTIAYGSTSTPALLVVGAANFLANRYSFTTDTSDSIGGQTGTNFGNATVTGGQLVLDGTSGTYMQLPGNLYSGANATALTVEFWATYGANPNFAYTFAFGVTNFVIGSGIVGFNHAMYCSHTGTGQTASATPGDPIFSQTANVTGNLDGRTVHVAVVFDPPNKLLSIYTNGVLEVANTNFTVPISSLNDQISWIGRSLWAADPYLVANIDEIRIFKGALSSISLKQSQDQGPNTLLADGPARYTLQPVSATVPAGQTASFTVATVGYLPITYQWYKGGSPVANATNATFSFTALLADNGTSIMCQASNTIGVTTYVTNSTTVSLNVFTPPTLAWIDSVNGGTGNGLWDTASLNWTNDAGAGPIAFSQTNGVLFDSRGTNSLLVDVQQPTVPYSITMNVASTYTLSSSAGTGVLNGQGTINKQGGGTLIIDLTNNLSGPVTISGGQLQIGNSDAFGSLGTAVVTNNGTLNILRSDTALNLGNAIHGTGALIQQGSGAVTLSGNNDYTGATYVNAGILYLTSATGLGTAAADTSVAPGAQLYVTGAVDINEPLSLNGVGDNNGALRKGGASATTENGPISLVADSTIGVDSGATLTLSNLVSGTAALTAVGNGTLALATNNSFSGGFNLNGSIVRVGAAGALGSGATTVAGTGRLILETGITFTNPVHATTVSPGAVTGLIMVGDNTNGTVTTVTGPLTFDVTAANGGNFYGPLSSGYLNVLSKITNSVTGVISSRDGFVRFSGGGSYTLFNLNQGTASLGANNGLSTTAVANLGASGNCAFDLNGFSQALAGLSDGGANAKFITNSSATPGTLTLNLAANSSFTGNLVGNLALVANGGASILSLLGTNAYSGNTTVNNGTLEILTATLATNSTVTVASGATLQLDFAETNSVGGLVLGGVAQSAGVYNNASRPTFITGSGSLLVSAAPVATNPTNVTFNVAGGTTLNLAWPADHLGWFLQTQTNNLNVGLKPPTNFWFDVPGSSTITNTSITLDKTQPAIFFRLRSP